MLILIIVSALFYVVWLAIKSESRLNIPIGYLAWIVHGAICFNYLIDENGWKLHITNAVLLVSWLSVLIVLVFKLNSQWVKTPLVVFVLLPFIALNNSSSLDLHSKEFSWELDLHISLSMLAYAILSVASLYAVSLWVKIKRLKNTQFETNTSLMSIIDEEKKLFQLTALGWLILSTSLLSGVIFIHDFMDQHLGHKVVFSLLAWLVFGLLIVGRISKGWRGEKLISLTIMGMTLLALGYLGSKLVLEWIL